MSNCKKLLWVCIIMLLIAPLAQARPKVIFDTDIARVDNTGNDRSDIDDLWALAMLNGLSNQGLCEIIGIVTNSKSNHIVEMIDAVNTYYNNPGIPIGLKEGAVNLIETKKSYAKLISEKFKHSQRSMDAPLASVLLRKILTEVSENDTVIYIHADAIANWDFLCIASFLQSGSDAISQLTGWELFNKKVDQFVSYIPCLPNKGVSINCPDWSNLPTTDASKLQYFIDHFQNALIGNTTAVEEAHIPSKLWKQSDKNPLKMAYRHYYTQTPPPWHQSKEIPKSISIYGDGLGVFYLIANQSSNHLFNSVNNGCFVLDENKKLRWSDKQTKPNHSYFYTVPEKHNELWKLLDELVCRKPVTN